MIEAATLIVCHLIVVGVYLAGRCVWRLTLGGKS